jgi:hypothetical protein
MTGIFGRNGKNTIMRMKFTKSEYDIVKKTKKNRKKNLLLYLQVGLALDLMVECFS